MNVPKQLIVYPKALFRVTANLEAEGLSQGQVGVVHEVPTGDCHDLRSRQYRRRNHNYK